jgi:dihydropteroate synthase
MSMAPSWKVGPDRVLMLDEPRLMGVVNATPDSFSDGGSYRSVDAMVGHALRCIEEGASIIDVGGESTRPGARRIDAAEQIDRVIPLIEQLRGLTDVLISIDTTQAKVAEAALDAGADIINDVAAGEEDERMLALAADRSCGMVLMHRRLPPDQDEYCHRYARSPVYDDVVSDVMDFLHRRCAAAEAAGVDHASIVIDPGLGFGKSVQQNYELIGRTAEFVRSGFPVPSAASRKSFVGAVTGVELPRERVIGSTAVSVIHYLAGVRLFRVHDVAAHRASQSPTAAGQPVS